MLCICCAVLLDCEHMHEASIGVALRSELVSMCEGIIYGPGCRAVSDLSGYAGTASVSAG